MTYGSEDPESMPVFGTIASQFNDPGVNEFYRNLMRIVSEKSGKNFDSALNAEDDLSEKIYIHSPQTGSLFV